MSGPLYDLTRLPLQPLQVIGTLSLLEVPKKSGLFHVLFWDCFVLTPGAKMLYVTSCSGKMHQHPWHIRGVVLRSTVGFGFGVGLGGFGWFWAVLGLYGWVEAWSVWLRFRYRDGLVLVYGGLRVGLAWVQAVAVLGRSNNTQVLKTALRSRKGKTRPKKRDMEEPVEFVGILFRRRDSVADPCRTTPGKRETANLPKLLAVDEDLLGHSNETANRMLEATLQAVCFRGVIISFSQCY